MPYPIGTVVTFYPGSVTTDPPVSGGGTTTITPVDITGIFAGALIAITNGLITEYRYVLSVLAGVVTLAAPLGGSYDGPVTATVVASGFQRHMLVYTKGGAPLGAITKYSIPSPRSRSILIPGQMAFYVPRNHPDTALIGDDRLVTVESDAQGDIWLGEMGRQQWDDDRVTVSCPDAFNLLTRAPLKLTEDEATIDDDTAAADVYALIIAKVNEEKAKHGEVQWGIDTEGMTKKFRGDLPQTGDGFDFITLISQRSQTEFAWTAAGPIPTLVCRDRFDSGPAVSWSDGVGGAIEEKPQYLSDPTERISSLKLTGQPTNIALYVPSWGTWAVHEITPEIDISLPDTTSADRPRWRRDEQVSVDWSLSKREQRRLGDLTTSRLWRMYYTFLYAYHDLNGMPFYDGKWSYEGPPADIEPDLTLDAWHTRNQMGLYHETTPAHIVMDSEQHGQFLIVVYFRTTGVKQVLRVSSAETYTYPIQSGQVGAGTVITIYSVSGSATAVVATWASDGNDVLLGDQAMYIQPDGTGTITLRELKSGPFSGRYVNIAEANWAITTPTPDLALDVGGLVGKIWPFERIKVSEWDPRRDGVGVKSNRASILNGELRTIPRWHFVNWGTTDATTILTASVGINENVIFIEADEGFPEPPFNIVVGEGTGSEGMVVIATFGSEWTVKRGTGSTTTLSADADPGDFTISVASAPSGALVAGRAVIIGGVGYIVSKVVGSTVTLKSPITGSTVASGATITFTTAQLIHDKDSPVSLAGAAAWDGFDFGYNWTDGKEYAQELLDRMSKARVMRNFKVANRGGAWAVGYGSVASITMNTQGPGGTGTARVLGWEIDEETGKLSAVTEEILP